MSAPSLALRRSRGGPARARRALWDDRRSPCGPGKKPTAGVVRFPSEVVRVVGFTWGPHLGSEPLGRGAGLGSAGLTSPPRDSDAVAWRAPGTNLRDQEGVGIPQMVNFVSGIAAAAQLLGSWRDVGGSPRSTGSSALSWVFPWGIRSVAMYLADCSGIEMGSHCPWWRAWVSSWLLLPSAEHSALLAIVQFVANPVFFFSFSPLHGGLLFEEKMCRMCCRSVHLSLET